MPGKSFSPYQAREVVVGFGCADATGDAVQLQAKFRAQYPELQDKEILLYLGRIHEKKGCDLLLKAFAGLTDKFPRLHLVIGRTVIGQLCGEIESSSRFFSC